MTLKIFCPNADRDHSKEVGDLIADLGHHALSLSARSPGPMCLKTGGPIGLQGGTLERLPLATQLDAKKLRELRTAIAQLLINAARSDGQEASDE